MTYVAPSDNHRHRRQQRRRALIGWGFGVLIVAGTIAAGVFGGSGGSDHHNSRAGDFTAYNMTQLQFEGIGHHLEQQTFVNRLQKVGLPENLAPSRWITLFRPVPLGTVCSYWTISDLPEHIARVCFEPGGLLVEKEETYAGHRTSEVEATPV